MRENQELQKKLDFVFRVIVDGCVASAVMGVRRQLIVDSKSISLMRLMQEVKASPEVLSKERYPTHFFPDHLSIHIWV